MTDSGSVTFGFRYEPVPDRWVLDERVRIYGYNEFYERGPIFVSGGMVRHDGRAVLARVLAAFHSESLAERVCNHD